MKTKIKEALQLAYKRLGLNEEVFERVAASVETFVTEETLSNFVDGAEDLLKHYQGVVDKARRETSDEKKRADELATKLAEAEAKLKDTGDDDKDKKNQPDNIAELIQSAVTAAVQPLQDKIKAFEDEGTAKQAITTAKDALFGNDYAKKYTQERDAAWERAVEIYEATGKKMTAEELKEKAMGYFNKDVARKGVDISKPFESEGNGENLDFSEDKAILVKEGLLKQ